MTIKPIVNKHSSSKSDNNGHSQSQSSVVVDVDGNRQLNVVTSTSSSSGSSGEHEPLNLGKRRTKSGAVKRRYHQQSRTANSKNVEDLNECNENAAKLLNVDTSNSETTAEKVDNSGGNSLNTNVNNKAVVELNADHDALAHGNNSTVNNSSAEDASGYNSGDEYADLRTMKVSNEEWEQRDMVFARTMEKHDFYIKKMVEDGACLFRAVAEQVYGDQNLHQIVRNQCMDYIKQNAAFYGAYITEDIDQYVNRKRNPSTHGNHLEIRAMSELYHRSIEIYVYHVKPISVFNGSEVTGLEPIRLSYQRGSHYDAILRANSTYSLPPQEIKNISRMPYELDQRQFKDAVKQSEDTLIEQTMMEDKLKATDFEATNEQIEEQVARESYISWIKENELRNQQQQQQQQQDTKISRISTTSTITSTTSTLSNSNQNVNTLMLNSNEEESNSMFDYVNFTDNQNSFDYSDWDDAQIIAQVMAESQKDYLDQLKKTAVQSHMYDCAGPSEASNTLHHHHPHHHQLQQSQQQQPQQQPINLSISSNSNSNNTSSSSCSSFTQNQIFAIEDCEKMPKASAASGTPSSTATATTTTRTLRRAATTVASSPTISAFFSAAADSVVVSTSPSAKTATSTTTTARASTMPATSSSSAAFFNLEPRPTSTSPSQTSQTSSSTKSLL